MRALFSLLATSFIAVSVPAMAATPVVDGTAGTSEYGAAKATVVTDPAAPLSNFGTPGNTATAGYNIYLNDTNDKLYGAVVQTGGVAAGTFANLYFDIDPTTGAGGSELGIEVTNKRGFVAGTSNYFDLSAAIDFSTTTVGGLTTTEFSINNSVFRDFIFGAQQQGYFGPGGYVSQDVRLNLSQSLSYSVAGGASYGSARLGTFSVAATAAVPEPATWAMMLIGFGGLGCAMRRRNDRPMAVRAV